MTYRAVTPRLYSLEEEDAVSNFGRIFPGYITAIKTKYMSEENEPSNNYP